MSIQLTKELLHTFVTNAARKTEKTLYATQTISASVFDNAALFYLVPDNVHHPLRRFIGLATPFILVSAFTDPKEADVKVRQTQAITCGAQPLATWRGLAGRKEGEPVSVAQPFDWESQRLEPLERNRARMLTAQYAQILPSLGSEGKQVLPMAVFTGEYGGCVAERPFYLVVFAPETDGGFANVVAVKYRGQRSDAVVVVDGADEQMLLRQSHWVEYDLLGSPVRAEMGSGGLGAALALLQGGGEKHRDAIKQEDEEQGMGCDEPAEIGSISDVDSVVSASDLALTSSYVVLHGVWETETPDCRVSVGLPLAPPASSQWMLELVSTPLTKDPEAHGQLRKLYMEIKRLETWCGCWMAGTKWVGGEREKEETNGASAQQGGARFEPHEWQRVEGSAVGFFVDEGSQQEGSTETVEDLGDAGVLERHRSRLGKLIDRFIDSSIQGLLQETDVAMGPADAVAGAGADGRVGADPPDMLEFPVRRDLDFVEQLWLLAHHGHDDSDLSEMLAAVAEGLETRRLQPLIHSGNQSSLAQVIRDALAMAQQNAPIDETAEKDRLASQLDLWIDEQPLDAFVLAGMQKVKADFWYLFVAQRLATPRQIDAFLGTELEPPCLVARFWCLLRVLEIWWLAKQAVPGLPRMHMSQIVASALEYFAARVADDQGAAVESLYSVDVKVAVYLPMYSSEVQDFAASVAEGFDPARYAAMVGAQGRLARISRMVLLTKTPALVDQHFSTDADEPGNLLDTSSQSADDAYSVFQASLF
ncbi:hypothetical protein LPJ56_002170 [Coemansia sp. RSA 2599]|nr:hypothetical protein LPJ75_001833 [Coemansia sp. RSA 2598]KAJ1826443.1 hypothetical protein LPJ56_002170 [Coemansia sp. RSA 2599]